MELNTGSSTHHGPSKIDTTIDWHRSVESSLNLVRELSRISAAVDDSLSADWMVRRVQFFSYELQTIVAPLQSPLLPSKALPSERDRLAALNQFFFGSKCFQNLEDPSKLADPTSAYLLSRVLTARRGAPIVIAFLYECLAARIGLKLDFADLKPTCLLKWNENGKTRYIDLTRGGAILTDTELIEMLQIRFQMGVQSPERLLETFGEDHFLSQYITELRQLLLAENDPEKLLFLQNTLIEYQPTNFQLLGERAALYRRLGNLKSSLADLKRYFSFHEREKAPAELVRLHDELLTLIEKQKTSIEVLD